MEANEIRKQFTKSLKGKDYLETAGRILLFHLDHPIPEGRIITEVLFADDIGATVKSTIYVGDVAVATGHGRAMFGDSSKNYSGRVFEKAETAAIGRALKHAGYGTETSDDSELDDDGTPPHLADAPQGKSKAGLPNSNDLTNEAVARVFWDTWKRQLTPEQMTTAIKQALGVDRLTQYTHGVEDANKQIELWILANEAEKEPHF